MESIEVPVLVVGGGSVGLSLALELGRRDVGTLVVDENRSFVSHPRTLGMSIRTMEHARRWGIADEIRELSYPADFPRDVVFCTSMGGLELARQTYPPYGERPDLPFSPENTYNCAQWSFDPIVAAAALSYDSVSLRRRWRLERIHQDDTGVNSAIRDLDADEVVHVRSQYVVGCDGARSRVRNLIGVDLAGEPLLNYSVGILIRSEDLLARHPDWAGERFIFVGHEGTFGNVMAVDGREHWRFTVMSANRVDLTRFAPRAWVERIFRDPDLEFSILSIDPWKRTSLTADRYVAGRVVLAGDAAHTMSPTGGFGMNTGVDDVVNLAWKLGALLDGWAGSQLLESYESERRPIAIRNAEHSAKNFRAWMAPSPEECRVITDETEEGERVRRDVGERMRRDTVAEWESYGVVLGLRYENSPICVSDGVAAPPDDPHVYVPSTVPGSRAPHSWLSDGRSMLDLFGDRFVLVQFGNATGGPDGSALTSALEQASVPLAVANVDHSEPASLYGYPLVLVRPDGHVAWRGARIDGDAAKHVANRVRGADDKI